MAAIPKVSADQLKSSVTATLWETDLASVPGWQAWLISIARVIYAVVRGLADGQLSLRTMSLVYTTLLSMVPLLAISFSVLKGFGVHNQIEPLMLGVLEPLGDNGVEITERVREFVENIKAGVLGSLGLGLLVYTVISLMQKIERAFNYVWYVTRPRSFVQRFSDYVSVIVIGPLLVFSSLGVTATVMNHDLVTTMTAIQPVGHLLALAGKLLPYVLIVLAFTFVNLFMPNTKVRFRSALVGALVAGVLWQLTGWVFASFIVGSAKYTAIYTGFATLIFFMIWLYLGWLILLVGTSISFYHQHPEYLSASHDRMRLSNRVKEKLALLVAYRVGARYYGDGAPWSVEALSQSLNIPAEAIERIFGSLEEAGLVTRTADEPTGYLPRKPPENILVKDVLDAVRAAEEQVQTGFFRLPEEAAVDDLAAMLDGALGDALAGRTLKDLALVASGDEAAGGEPTEPARES